MTRLKLLLFVVLVGAVLGISYPDYGQSSGGRIVFDRGDSIYIIDTNGQNERLLTLGETPDFSHSGDRIAFSRSSRIYVMELLTLAEIQYTSPPQVFARGPSWGPNDETLVFWQTELQDAAGNTIQDAEILSVDLNTFIVQPLTNDSNPDWEPAVNPVTGQVVYAEFDGSDWELILINADGSNPTRLTENSRFDWQPEWSPDGTKVAFSTGQDIYIMDADGTNLVQVTDSVGRSWEPSWSPDGSELVFVQWNSTGSDNDLYIVGVDGSNLRQLTDSPDRDRDPSWGN